MLDAQVLAGMMQAYVAAAIPEFVMTDDAYAGGKTAFFGAIARAVVDHIHSSAVVNIPKHVTAKDPQGIGNNLLDAGAHLPGTIK